MDITQVPCDCTNIRVGPCELRDYTRAPVWCLADPRRMAPATPGSQQDPDGPDVTRGAPRQGGQLNIQCSQRFQIESSNSAISDTGCLVKTTRERGNAAYLPIQESHG
ncbi:hypothetical protein NDU88_007062 [Pleurodeles waltl]|uniref:Uncharacterized protein n=1 Tax=Pleurodeles waltl TaxID=8319 RepID=A0AAV7PN75_PLEWA|nr:hypothetical protein NDU88_007062 [Pleurodeles waltl]